MAEIKCRVDKFYFFPYLNITSPKLTMAEKVIPHISRAKEEMVAASEMQNLSSSVRHALEKRAKNLDKAISSITEKNWHEGINPSSMVSLPHKSHVAERKVLAAIYSGLKDVPFSDEDIKDRLYGLASRKIIPTSSFYRHCWTRRLYFYGLTSMRRVLGVREYKFNPRGHKILEELLKEFHV